MSIEDKFFQWEGWSELDVPGDIQFTGCVFKKDVPPFKKGDRVDAICFFMSMDVMCVYNGSDETVYPISLSIGEPE